MKYMKRPSVEVYLGIILTRNDTLKTGFDICPT